jgi:hypothetical protein
VCLCILRRGRFGIWGAYSRFASHCVLGFSSRVTCYVDTIDERALFDSAVYAGDDDDDDAERVMMCVGVGRAFRRIRV